MKRSTLAWFAACALAAPAAHAYRTPTHEALTAQATVNSQLPTRLPELAASLGVVSLDTTVAVSRRYIFGFSFFEKKLSVLDVLRFGAEAEDDIPRFTNHFFNPTAPAGQEGYHYGILSGRPSREWGLEETEISGQDYSLRDARQYLRDTIRGTTENDRRQALVNMLRTLGHTSHLLQDLGQPQHTRNDSHGSGSTYENYAFNNPTGVLGSYPNVSLPAFADYWATGDGRGFANYSNREYITAGTNFTGRRTGNLLEVRAGPDFALPSGASTSVEKKQITDADLLGPVGPNQSLIGEIWFVTRSVEDRYTGGTTGPLRMSTFSIFDEDLSSMGFDWTMTLTRFNLAPMQAQLGPRAIGYSAGMIDKFLRGKISISPPPSGLYAWADHASAQGFSKLRLKLTNDTPSEKLDGGNVVAYVKYHVNECYQPDLSGEFKPDLVPPCPNYRSVEEKMSASGSKPLSLDPGADTEITFDLATPVPMGATDVYVQVLYEGKVGTEEGGVAFGARDISEPTFIAIFNGTDAFEIPAGFYLSRQIIAGIASAPFNVIDQPEPNNQPPNGVYNSPPDVDVEGADIRYELIFPNNTRIATFSAVPRGRFSRVAVLMSTTSVPYALRSVGAGFNQTNNFTATPRRMQLDPETGGMTVASVHQTRATPQWSSVVSYRYYPTSQADLDTFPASETQDATKPVDATMDPMP